MQHQLTPLLSKFIATWIWTVLFAFSSAATYRLVEDQYLLERISSLENIVGLLLVIATVVVIFLAWYSLYRFLIEYLIPTIQPIFGEMDISQATDDSLIHLKRAFWRLLAGGLLLFLTQLETYIYTLFRG